MYKNGAYLLIYNSEMPRVHVHVHMIRTFPKPCYFNFFNFLKKVLINFILFKFFKEIKLYASYSVY